jgi:parallel beta-helix repeat protein
VLNNCSNVTISGYQFVDIAGDAIVLNNCSNVTVTANDFSGDVGGIYAYDSANITVTWNRFQDIGDGTIGGGHSNYIQFNGTTGGLIANNKGIGGNTVDMISIYESGGTAASPLVVEDNALESPLPPATDAWSSGSGTCINAADGGGSYIEVEGNTCLNGGQVGIAVSGGSNISVDSNIVYGSERAASNVGMYVWNQTSGTCSNIEAGGNRVFWLTESGAANPAWESGNCGTVTNWDVNNTNVWQDTTIDPTTLQVTL